MRIGRTGREKVVTKAQLREMLANAPQREQVRVNAALGRDLEGRQVSPRPLTLEQVADVEHQLYGERVTPEAIAQTLKKYGINRDVIDAATGAQVGTVGLDSLVDGAPEGLMGFRTAGTLAEAAGDKGVTMRRGRANADLDEEAGLDQEADADQEAGADEAGGGSDQLSARTWAQLEAMARRGDGGDGGDGGPLQAAVAGLRARQQLDGTQAQAVARMARALPTEQRSLLLERLATAMSGNAASVARTERRQSAVGHMVQALRAQPAAATEGTIARNAAQLREAGLDPDMGAGGPADEKSAEDAKKAAEAAEKAAEAAEMRRTAAHRAFEGARQDWNSNLDEGDTAFEDAPRDVQQRFIELRRRVKAGEITIKDARDQHFALQEQANAGAAARPERRAAGSAVVEPAAGRGGRADRADPDQRHAPRPGVGRDGPDAAPAPAGAAGAAGREGAPEGVALTDHERAQRAWDQVARSVPGMPRFADLSQADQKTFVEFGEKNWTRQDVARHAQRVAAPGVRYLKRGEVGTFQYDGKPMVALGVSLADLQNSPGVAAAVGTIERRGLGHLLTSVEWAVTSTPVDFDGAVMKLDSRSVVLRGDVFNDDARVEHVFLHEMAHLADEVSEDGPPVDGI